MVSQDDMQKEESIHQSLLKEPPTSHDAVPRCDLTGQAHTRAYTCVAATLRSGSGFGEMFS